MLIVQRVFPEKILLTDFKGVRRIDSLDLSLVEYCGFASFEPLLIVPVQWSTGIKSKVL